MGLFRRRCLRGLARRVGTALKDRFGTQRFYGEEEMREISRSLRLRGEKREAAYGMFADEETCEGLLRRIGSARGARDLRIFLGGQMFGTGSVMGYDTMWNRFHDPDDEVAGGLSSLGASQSATLGDGDGGGFDAGDGGI